MGFSGIGVWQLLIVLLIVALIFGTKKLKNVGGDLGSAMKSFRSAMHDGAEDDKAAEAERASLAKDPDDAGQGHTSAARERQS